MRRLIEEVWWKLRYSSRATAWLHFCAMWAPFNSWRLFFYRLRGTRIGRNVYVAPGCYFEESRPWLITIEDDVNMGPGNMLITHDAVMFPRVPYRYGEVVLKRGCRIGARNTILPGVTIGEDAMVAAGCLIRKDVPSGMLAIGSNDTRLLRIDDAVERGKARREADIEYGNATKYPWKMRA